MNKPTEARLGAFLREVSNWRWSDFVNAEIDPSYTSNQAIIFALVRSCAMQNLQAIKLSINRLDGKLVTPLKFEYPKVFYLYPNVKLTKGVSDNSHTEIVDIPTAEVELTTVEPTVEENDLPSLSIRATISKMSDYPRQVPQKVANDALAVETFLKKNGPKPETDPMVKSVVAAHLLTMAQNRSIDALNEVFDAIDGKLAETLKVLGEDLFVVNYSFEAPEGSVLNEDGILQIEATKAQEMWKKKLSGEG